MQQLLELTEIINTFATTFLKGTKKIIQLKVLKFPTTI